MPARLEHNLPADGAIWAACKECGWQGPMHARGKTGDAEAAAEAAGDRDQHNDARHPILIAAPTPAPAGPPEGMDAQLFYEAARHVLGHHHAHGGWIPGGFTHHLLRA